MILQYKFLQNDYLSQHFTYFIKFIVSNFISFAEICVFMNIIYIQSSLK